MKHFLLVASALVVSGIYSNASAQTGSPGFPAKWLLGKWENQTARGKMVEEWSVINDSSYAGHSYRITAADSVNLESIILKKEGNDLYYIPTVKGQNNEQPVKFKLISSSATQIVFENPAHDFPQKISYTREGNDSLVAEISGLVNGQLRARKFPMKKVR